MNVKQKILFIICIFLFCFSISYAQNGCIFGKIVDSNTGEFLSNVSVSLILGGNTVGQLTTKEDGLYTFDITQSGNYQLTFKKTEYDKFSYSSFYVSSNESIRKDVPLQKPARFICITEVNNPDEEIDSLDIGAITCSEIYYVNFVNWGGVTINYVTDKMCEWITEVTPSSGTLKPNESNRITIKIDPDKFEAGKTTGKILIITNNGNKVLSIKAIGKFPEIITLPPTQDFADGDSWPNAFNAEISFNGRHTFKEMGYCFSDINSVPTINDNVVLANDLGTYAYKDYWADENSFPWGEWSDDDPLGLEYACHTYYVRAFLIYENENNLVLYSDNIEQFTLWDILCP